MYRRHIGLMRKQIDSERTIFLFQWSSFWISINILFKVSESKKEVSVKWCLMPTQQIDSEYMFYFSSFKKINKQLSFLLCDAAHWLITSKRFADSNLSHRADTQTWVELDGFCQWINLNWNTARTVPQVGAEQKMWNASRFCVSSLRRGHANLLCIVPILVYVLPKQVQGGLCWWS